MNVLSDYVVMDNMANDFKIDYINNDEISCKTTDLIKRFKFLRQNVSNIISLHPGIDDYSIIMNCGILCTRDMHKKYEIDGCIDKLDINKNILKDLAFVQIESNFFYAGVNGCFHKKSSNLFNYSIKGIVNYETFIKQLNELGIECDGFFGKVDKDDFNSFALSILRDYPIFCLKEKEKNKIKVLERK